MILSISCSNHGTWRSANFPPKARAECALDFPAGCFVPRAVCHAARQLGRNSKCDPLIGRLYMLETLRLDPPYFILEFLNVGLRFGQSLPLSFDDLHQFGIFLYLAVGVLADKLHREFGRPLSLFLLYAFRQFLL